MISNIIEAMSALCWLVLGGCYHTQVQIGNQPLIPCVQIKGGANFMICLPGVAPGTITECNRFYFFELFLLF